MSWAAGDLALCVTPAADGWWWNLAEWAWRPGPRCGGIYAVRHVRPADQALQLADFPGEWYEAQHFTRIAPHEADADDAQIIAAMRPAALPVPSDGAQ